MTSHRVDPVRQESAALKQIAGLIQKLSYRDMNLLADIVGNKIPSDNRGPYTVALSLLEAADAILNADQPPAKKPDPHARPFR